MIKTYVVWKIKEKEDKYFVFYKNLFFIGKSTKIDLMI